MSLGGGQEWGGGIETILTGSVLWVVHFYKVLLISMLIPLQIEQSMTIFTAYHLKGVF